MGIRLQCFKTSCFVLFLASFFKITRVNVKTHSYTNGLNPTKHRSQLLHIHTIFFLFQVAVILTFSCNWHNNRRLSNR